MGHLAHGVKTPLDPLIIKHRPSHSTTLNASLGSSRTNFLDDRPKSLHSSVADFYKNSVEILHRLFNCINLYKTKNLDDRPNFWFAKEDG
jgi:hypothetical protein